MRSERPFELAHDVRAWRIFSLIFLPTYLLFAHFGTGLRGEHVALSVAYSSCFWLGRRAVLFAKLALPFVLGALVYDNVRLFLDLRGEVHVADLYYLELAFFGVPGPDGQQILPFFFSGHTSDFLDLVTGLAYLGYLVELAGFAVLLFLIDRDRLEVLGTAFLLVNLMACVTFILYPAAPPWYVDLYGLGPADPTALPNAAGATRFDALLDVTVFQTFYARNPNVFGAMPSLHCAYPMLVLCGALTMGRAYVVLAGAFLSLVCFSAVYLQHHYVLDVMAGIAFAAFAYSASFRAWTLIRARGRHHD